MLAQFVDQSDLVSAARHCSTIHFHRTAWPLGHFLYGTGFEADKAVPAFLWLAQVSTKPMTIFRHGCDGELLRYIP